MKVYHFKRTHFLPIRLEEAWMFFSSPENLSKITPTYMDFRILYNSDQRNEMYPGQIIKYRVKILPGIRVRWVTEITHVDKPNYFVDEQRFGPYALWHHQHHFREAAGGVEMTDEVNYAIPFGILGRLANRLFVTGQLNSIFDYRTLELDKIFPKMKETMKIGKLR
jgi:ligand-binding SRPBCC domain-containing protein